MNQYFLILLIAALIKIILSRFSELKVIGLPNDTRYDGILDRLDEADEYMSKNMLSEAIDIYNSVLKERIRPIEKLKIYCTLSSAYLMQENNESAQEAALKAHEISDSSTMKTYLGSFLLGFARGKYCLAKGIEYSWNYLPPYCNSTFPELNLRPYQMFLFQFFTPIIGGVLGGLVSNLVNAPNITIEWLKGHPSSFTLIGTIIGIFISSTLFSALIDLIGNFRINKFKAIIISFYTLFVLTIVCLILMPYVMNDIHFWFTNVVLPTIFGRLYIRYIIPRFHQTVNKN